jgi:hypothetical protein
MTTSAIATHEVTYLEAISQAMDEEMSQDERVFLMGRISAPTAGHSVSRKDFNRSMVNGESSIRRWQSPGLSGQPLAPR